jgi:hypothetical protein
LGPLAAVWFLLQSLRYHILPILFPPPGEYVPEAAPNGANLLFSAFASIVAAIALEVLETLGSIVYRAIAG